MVRLVVGTVEYIVIGKVCIYIYDRRLVNGGT